MKRENGKKKCKNDKRENGNEQKMKREHGNEQT